MDMGDLIAKYDRRVPRYTSYPTAPHFSSAIDGDAYAEWLASLPGDAALSLYLHVPFCVSLCLFCGCHTTVVRRPEPLAEARWNQPVQKEWRWDEDPPWTGSG